MEGEATPVAVENQLTAVNVPMPVCGDAAHAWTTAMADYQLGGHDAKVNPTDLGSALAAINAGAASMKIAQQEIALYTTLDCRPAVDGTPSCVS
jgi:hypothetical protein